MEDFQPEILESLVRRHRPELDGPLRLERIRTGKFNTSYFVSGDKGELVLRVAPPDHAVFCFYERKMMRQEPQVHSLVRERTSVPVAAIIAYDESRELIDRDYLLMERLPGAALTEVRQANYAKVLGQVGSMLAEVHSITSHRYGYLGPHRPMEPQAAWAPAFRIMWNRLIDDVVAVGHYEAEEERLMRGLLEERMRHFERPVPSRLLHMDIWGQNILVNASSQVTGLVDWDRALWGDPEIEFAVLDYCGISEPAFWKGYGRRRDTSPEARVRQVLYLLYELQKYIVIRQGRSGDMDAARRYKGQVMRIARSLQ